MSSAADLAAALQAIKDAFNDTVVEINATGSKLQAIKGASPALVIAIAAFNATVRSSNSAKEKIRMSLLLLSAAIGTLPPFIPPPNPVGNIPPTVTLTADRTSVPAGDPVTFTAVPADVDGTIAKVGLYKNGVLVPGSEKTAAPWVWTQSNLAVGSDSYSVRATDDDNATGDSTAITVTAFVSVDVALAANGGLASASSTYSANYPVTAPIAGYRTSALWANGGGWNDGTLNVYPDWHQVTYSAMQLIRELVLVSVTDDYNAPEPNDNTIFTREGPTDIQAQRWDGNAWVDVPGGHVTQNNKVVRRFPLNPPILMDRHRFLINASLAGYSRIVASRAFTEGTPAVAKPPPALAATVSGADVLLTATSSEPTTSSMKFYRDGVLISTLTSPTSSDAVTKTYRFTDSNVAAGTHSYVATAGYADLTSRDSNAVSAVVGSVLGESPEGFTGDTVIDRTGARWTLGANDGNGNFATLKDGVHVNLLGQSPGYGGAFDGEAGFVAFYVYSNRTVMGWNNRGPVIFPSGIWWEVLSGNSWVRRLGDPRFAQFNVVNPRTGVVYGYFSEALQFAAEADTILGAPGQRVDLDVMYITKSVTIQSTLGTGTPIDIYSDAFAFPGAIPNGAITIDSRQGNYSQANPMRVTLNNVKLRGRTPPPQTYGLHVLVSATQPLKLFWNGGSIDSYKDGVLTSGVGGAGPGCEYHFIGVEFMHSGLGIDGQDHNGYVSHCDLLELIECYSHGGNLGHPFKSKSDVTLETNCDWISGVDGTDSFCRDYAEAGDLTANGVVYVKGPNGDAPSTYVRYGQEAYGPNGGFETDHTRFTDRATWNGCYFINLTTTPPNSNLGKLEYGFIELKRDGSVADGFGRAYWAQFPLGVEANGVIWTQAMRDRVLATPVNMGPVNFTNNKLVGVGAQLTHDRMQAVCQATGGAFSGNEVLTLAEIEQYTKPNGHQSYRKRVVQPGEINPNWRAGLPLRQFSIVGRPPVQATGMGPSWGVTCFGQTSTTPYDSVNHILYSAAIGGHTSRGPNGDQNGIYAQDWKTDDPVWYEVLRATPHLPFNDIAIAQRSYFPDFDLRPTGRHVYYSAVIAHLSDGPTIVMTANSAATTWYGELGPDSPFFHPFEPAVDALHLSRVGISEPWDKVSPTSSGWPLAPRGGFNAQATAIDPTTQMIYVWTGDGYILRLNPFTKTWTELGFTSEGSYYNGSVIDPLRGFFVLRRGFSAPQGTLTRFPIDGGAQSTLLVTGPAAAYMPAGNPQDGTWLGRDSRRDLYLYAGYAGVATDGSGLPYYKLFEINPDSGASTFICDSVPVADEAWNNFAYDAAFRGILHCDHRFYIPSRFCPLEA